jgi:hypothetical protein
MLILRNLCILNNEYASTILLELSQTLNELMLIVKKNIN